MTLDVFQCQIRKMIAAIDNLSAPSYSDAINNLLGLSNPSAITFPRFNADNSVNLLSASSYRTALGLGTGDSPTFTGVTAPLLYVASSGAGMRESNVGRVGIWSQLTHVVQFVNADMFLNTGTAFGWVFSGSPSSEAPDLLLYRDAAGVLAQRAGTNAQAFRLYNTYTDASNYERAIFGFTSNVLRIGTENAGTGSARAIDFVVGGTARWGISTAGHWLAAADNTYDIGASGANRPKRVYAADGFFAPFVVAGGNMSSPVYLSSGGNFRIEESANGCLILKNFDATTWDRIQLGGISNLFPAIKRSGSDIEIVKADGTVLDTAIILGSPDGTRYRITVSNAGVVTSTAT